MFNDTGQTIYSFFFDHDKLLECPECTSCIKLKKDHSIVICNKCGYQKDLRNNGYLLLCGEDEKVRLMVTSYI